MSLQPTIFKQGTGLAGRAPLGGPQQQVPGLDTPLAVEHEAAPHELAEAFVQLRHQLLSGTDMTQVRISILAGRDHQSTL